MDARESLAKGNRRDGYLCYYVCADQWATAQDSAFESASCCFAWGGIDGFDWCDDAAARVSRSQLRHAGPIARDDADLSVSASGAFFELAADAILKFSRTSDDFCFILTCLQQFDLRSVREHLDVGFGLRTF